MGSLKRDSHEGRIEEVDVDLDSVGDLIWSPPLRPVPAFKVRLVVFRNCEGGRPGATVQASRVICPLGLPCAWAYSRGSMTSSATFRGEAAN